MVVLDATAGNRMMWKNKNPPLTVFMDKKTDLRVRPDVIGVWGHAPFRDDVFDCILFDPPHIVRTKGADPRFTMHVNYGSWKSKTEAIIGINKAQKEFLRLTKRLCFKWCNTRDGPTLWTLLPFFKEWKETHRKEWNTKGSGTIRGTSFWVTFVRCLG